jgi:cystathionine gamma-synthase
MDPVAAAELDPATLAVTAGRGTGEPGSPLTVPPVLTSVYREGGEVGYAREGNPTWSALEEALGVLEGGDVLAFASGIAAVAAVLETLPVGARVVAPRGAYLGTRGLLADLTARGRLVTDLVDITDTDAVLTAADGAALLWVESPTNPLLELADLPALIEGAHAMAVPVAVDATFVTPLLQRPLDLGADVVVHSATKLIAGHSDVLLGVTATRDAAWLERLETRRRLHGAVPGPMEAWLVLRGLRTLPVRLERAQANAGELARRLAEHPAVTRVRYPGLPEDPGHARAAAQLRGFGAMVSVEVAGGAAAADAVCAGARLIAHVTSLGGIETSMERRGRYADEADLPPSLIRISVGCEHVEDLWADLDRALRAAAP